jgi:hypothetical protein
MLYMSEEIELLRERCILVAAIDKAIKAGVWDIYVVEHHKRSITCSPSSKHGRTRFIGTGSYRNRDQSTPILNRLGEMETTIQI